eukprot:4327433-Prymnesium_polylepis.1
MWATTSLHTMLCVAAVAQSGVYHERSDHKVIGRVIPALVSCQKVCERGKAPPSPEGTPQVGGCFLIR